MANAIGYEELTVTAVASSPALAGLTGGVACAVFYVDPNAGGIVRWRADPTSPTRGLGFPLGPGRWISVAGEGNIRNSEFILNRGSHDAIIIHAIYFDRVDVVAADFATDPGDAQMADISETLTALRELSQEMLSALRQIALGTSLLTNTDLAQEINNLSERE